MPQVNDWIAQTYATNSPPMNASRVVNMFAETQVQDAKSKAAVGIWMHPGTAPFASCGKGAVVAFITMAGLVYALTTDSLYSINHAGVATYLGHTSVSINGVSIDGNGSVLCWVDGVSGWTYSAAHGINRINDPNFYPSNTVTYYDTYFVFSRRGTQDFFISPPQWDGVSPFVSLTNPNSLEAPQVARKEATSDLIVGCANVHQQLFVFGEKRCEVWYDAANPAPQFPFQRSFGALIQRGLMSPYTLVLEDNTIFMLGDDLIYYRLNGFVPERVSNHGAETQWQKYRDVAHSKAFSYTVMGHKMIALTFPAAKATWVLDLSTKRWHERESWTADHQDSSIGRWRANCALNNSSSIQNYPEVIFGDCLSGRVDQMNNNVFTEFGQTMRAMIIGPPIHSDRRRVFMRKFEIDVESGVGAPFATQVINQFCAGAVTITAPTELETADALTNTPLNISTFVFSNWVYLPNLGDGVSRTVGFGNNLLNLWISIGNTESTPSNEQIVIQINDASHAAVLDARYPWLDWSHWLWVGITVDIPTHRIQCWISTSGHGDVQLTASHLVWSSTNPFQNDSGDPWFVEPGG